jgi:hypothetical protein
LDAFSQQLVDHGKRLAVQLGAPYEFRPGRVKKEKLIDRVDRERKHPDGLLAVLCVQECCTSVKLCYAEGKPELKYAPRPQRVLYYYYNNPVFGRIYVRIQTWFPYPVQIYVNGHDWLAHQMANLRLGFVQDDNAFTELDDPKKAQELANRLPGLDWPRILWQWTKPLMPLLKHDWFKRLWYDWTIEECEYSTDLLFRSKKALGDLYPVLVNHAVLQLSAEDVLNFLGRRLHWRFDGEVLTECKKRREPGSRVKFRVKKNWLKMYDKFGLILRIETVINDPRDFKIFRSGTRRGKRVQDWFPMARRVTNLWRYCEIAHAANRRLLDALAKVDSHVEAQQTLAQVCQPVADGQRRRRGLNPVQEQDQTLFRAVLRGDHFIKGFRNADIVAVLFEQPTQDALERKRRSAQVTRRLRLLRAHKLIKKVARTTKYYPTDKGLLVMGAAISIKDNYIPRLMEEIKRLAS